MSQCLASAYCSSFSVAGICFAACNCPQVSFRHRHDERRTRPLRNIQNRHGYSIRPVQTKNTLHPAPTSQWVGHAFALHGELYTLWRFPALSIIRTCRIVDTTPAATTEHSAFCRMSINGPQPSVARSGQACLALLPMTKAPSPLCSPVSQDEWMIIKWTEVPGSALSSRLALQVVADQLMLVHAILGRPCVQFRAPPRKASVVGSW